MRRPLMKTVVNELVPSDLKRRAFFMLEESLTPIAQGERRDARAAGKALYLKLTDEGASAAGGVEAGVLRSGTCRSGDPEFSPQLNFINADDATCANYSYTAQLLPYKSTMV